MERVDSVLRSYADRGLFREFVGRAGAGGSRTYRFRWLTDAVFELRFDPAAGTLTFLELLPNVKYRSPMDNAFRRYLKERSAAALPAHRRLDPGKLRVNALNRGGSLSVRLTVREGEYEYGARRAISLVNEIFHDFLRGPYYEYMVENFNEPEE